MNRIYRVRAVKWAEGWELHVEGVGVTQVRTLDKAEVQVRDYLASLYERDFDSAKVFVVPSLGGLEDEVAAVRKEAAAAAAAQAAAGEHSRRVARALRARGLSVTDSAAVLGVSRGRVSQLVNS